MEKDSLIGRTLILMVSDPWEFGTEHGVGPFEVTVEQVSETHIFLKVVSPWTYMDIQWEYLVGTGRHGSLVALFTGEKISTNLIRGTLENANIDPETFGAKSYRGQFGGLIGTLQLKTSERS